VTSAKEVAVMVDNTVGVVVLHILSAVSRFPHACSTYSVFVIVTLEVDEAVTRLKIGKVVVLVTTCAVPTHLTQTVLTNAFACLAKLLKADCFASFEVLETLVGALLVARLSMPSPHVIVRVV
jgi:hypothetical protein